MKLLIIASSLNPESKSRQLANELKKRWSSEEIEVTLLDLKEADLPMCDGSSAYGDERVVKVNEVVGDADAFVIATPVYNFSINAALKNLIELTGRSMSEKTVGFLCAAGGHSSYMSVMGIANSLMLDFRAYILPRFVYVTPSDWEGQQLSEAIDERIGEFASSFLDFARRMTK